jgi:D-glycero-D-manno-heptose 1,7-bisphosphate phosphatase
MTGGGRNGERALIFDRDGVVNIDHGYVATQDRFEFMPGVLALARTAYGLGYRLVVATNQSGVARGYYSESDFHALTGWMAQAFAEAGAPLTGVAYCPFLPGAPVAAYDRDSRWRKPAPGMLLELARRYGLDLSRSVMIGDQPGDMAAARAAGVGKRLLLAGAEGPPPRTPDADAVLARLDEAVGWL